MERFQWSCKFDLSICAEIQSQFVCSIEPLYISASIWKYGRILAKAAQRRLAPQIQRISGPFPLIPLRDQEPEQLLQKKTLCASHGPQDLTVEEAQTLNLLRCVRQAAPNCHCGLSVAGWLSLWETSSAAAATRMIT